jgi:hypothetical protein
MNEDPSDSERGALKRALDAVAAEDSRLQASPHVRTAVMQMWNEDGPRLDQRRSRRYVVPLLAIGSLASAAAVLFVVNVYRVPSRPSVPAPTASRNVTAPESVERPPSVAPAPETRVARAAMRRSQGRHGQAATRDLQRAEQGLVLAMEPTLDDSTLSIVRVRVPRAALAMLGVVPPELDDSGSVDLEMLVGEDGAARLIRRALPVAMRQE